MAKYKRIGEVEMRDMSRLKRIHIKEVKDERCIPDPEKLYSRVNGESLEWLLRYADSLDEVFSKEDRLLLADLIYWYRFFCHIYVAGLKTNKAIGKED